MASNSGCTPAHGSRENVCASSLDTHSPQMQHSTAARVHSEADRPFDVDALCYGLRDLQSIERLEAVLGKYCVRRKQTSGNSV
ncbi:hypothetical protein KIN20_020003 [Parelaphostrongylus tenuis]|uniref:Uncharacterized protein n=1 Tax=Parelaphostrongylus tenuis TaxID=148309 RepID=A0AAD5QQI9_PARTN|nr:hypothetical protein KIN20_020003 [Parelaphostrongylus tenuis]